MCCYKGLRTLCIAIADIDEEFYENWKEIYEQASTSIDNREQKMEDAAELIEKVIFFSFTSGYWASIACFRLFYLSMAGFRLLSMSMAGFRLLSISMAGFRLLSLCILDFRLLSLLIAGLCHWVY